MALFCVYVLYKILTNDLAHLNNSIEKQVDVQQQANEVLRNLNGSIQSNTEVLKIIERRIK